MNASCSIGKVQYRILTDTIDRSAPTPVQLTMATRERWFKTLIWILYRQSANIPMSATAAAGFTY